MKVVTIDLDIIMAPIINSYNDMISNDYPVDDLWEDYPYMKNGKADLYIYDYLNQFLYEAYGNMKDLSKVYFIESHEEIVRFLKDCKEPIDLYNIDHHHDVGYDEKWGIKLLKAPNCGNWVKYLKDTNKIKSYTWIKDEFSSTVERGGAKYIDKEVELGGVDLIKLGQEADMVIICSSFDWVPRDYQILYYGWQNLLDIFKKMRGQLEVDEIK